MVARRRWDPVRVSHGSVDGSIKSGSCGLPSGENARAHLRFGGPIRGRKTSPELNFEQRAALSARADGRSAAAFVSRRSMT